MLKFPPAPIDLCLYALDGQNPRNGKEIKSSTNIYEEKEEKLLIWYNKTSNVELSWAERSVQVVLLNQLLQLQQLYFLRIWTIFLSKMPNFREIIFSAKFSEKVCEIRKKIFEVFRISSRFVLFWGHAQPVNPDGLIFFKMFTDHMNLYNTKSLFMSARADLSSKFPNSYLNPIFHNKPYEFSPS